MSNAILAIFPYKTWSTWVFDDPAVDLKQEPFVSGVPEMIDLFVTGIPEAEKGFKLLFSASPFPGYQVELAWLREEYGGNWYRWDAKGMEGWLCPAMFQYFKETPPNLYCKAEALPPRP